jgi:low affinity Fe/Cu permease
MATTISEYFLDELMSWNESIMFCYEEIAELQQKLEDVIRRNSIVDIAQKVGVHQEQLEMITDKFQKLQLKFEHQEEHLVSDDAYVDNAIIDDKIEKQQANLRHKMQASQKEYVDIKFECYHFLSKIFKK